MSYHRYDLPDRPTDWEDTLYGAAFFGAMFLGLALVMALCVWALVQMAGCTAELLA